MAAKNREKLDGLRHDSWQSAELIAQIRGLAVTKSGRQVTMFQELNFGGVAERLKAAVLKN